MIFNSKNVILLLTLLAFASPSYAQVCQYPDGDGGGGGTLPCDMTYYNTVATCDKSGGSSTLGTRPSCPAKPMPMLDTPKKSFIADYSPYLYAYARNPDDKTLPYVGDNYRGTPGDTFDSMFGGGVNKNLTGGDTSSKKSLAACKQQIKPTTTTDAATQAKLVRFQLDNCANQYILQAAIYPFQKENSRQLSGEDPAHPSKVTGLATECQPLKTFTETDSEYSAGDYIKAAWTKLLDKPGEKMKHSGGIPDAAHEPMLPSGLTLENTIPAKSASNLTLANIATIPYEEILDPSHPFSPRWDYAYNERDHYSPQTSEYISETDNSVYCAGIRDTSGDSGGSATDKEKEELMVKVDVLAFRQKRFNEGIMARIHYNNRCIQEENPYPEDTPLATVMMNSYCYKITRVDNTGIYAQSKACWECFGNSEHEKVDDKEKHPACSSHWDGTDLKIKAPLMPGALNAFNTTATCSEVERGPRDAKNNIDKLCKDLRKPYTNLNKLKMRYHNPDDPDDTNKERVVLKNGVPEGLTFKEYFGNRMPYPRLWDTGSSIQKTSNTNGNDQPPMDTSGQYAAIVGVGREAAAGPADSDAVKQHPDQRCLFGGWGGDVSIEGVGSIKSPDPVTSWTELKLYQANTLRQANISCIGRYDKVFKSGSSENMMMQANGGEWSRMVISKCPRQTPAAGGAGGGAAPADPQCTYMTYKEYEDAGRPQTDDSTAYVIQLKPESIPLSWRGYLASTNSDAQFPNFGGSGETKTGLDNAQLGDIVVMPKGGVDGGDKPGLAKMGLVIEVNLTGKTNCCYVKVLESDNGKFPDVCGTTDAFGQMKTRTLYKTGKLPEATKKELEKVGQPVSCEDTKLLQCEFAPWDNAKLYRPSDDVRTGCDKTKAGDCPPDGATGGGGGGGGGGTKADCDAVFGIDKKESYKADPADVQQCIQRGYDPPAKWRPNNGVSPGVRVGGGAGFTYGTVQAPENPPGAVGAGLSISQSLMNFAMKFLASATSSSNNGQPGGNNAPSSCPVSNDTTGLYGVDQALSAGSTPLSCGGTMPLSTYELVLNRNTDRLATTENGAYYVWLYQKQDAHSYAAAGTNPVVLPKYLCMPRPCEDGTGGTCMVKSVDLNPPLAQVITYNAGSDSFVIHLIPSSPHAQEGSNELITDPDEPERYLKIPIEGGVPKVPADCALETDYYMLVDSLKADMVIHAATNRSCENNDAVKSGTAACTVAISTTTPNASCDTLSLYPKGSSCDGKVQYAVLDRTNILYPPRSAPSLFSLPDQAGLLAQSISGSTIYAQSQTIFEVLPTAPSLTMNEGGTLIMKDNSRLVMSGPATLNPSTRKVTLKNGGVLVNAAGTLVRKIPNGATYSLPNPVLPLRLQLESSMTLPSGYLLMTQAPAPYVRLPIDKPE